jgi:hypothetical protein
MIIFLLRSIYLTYWASGMDWLILPNISHSAFRVNVSDDTTFP